MVLLAIRNLKLDFNSNSGQIFIQFTDIDETFISFEFSSWIIKWVNIHYFWVFWLPLIHWVPELSSRFFGKDKKPKGKPLILYIDFPISFPVSTFLFICPALQLQQYNRLLIDIFSCLWLDSLWIYFLRSCR